MTSAEKSSNFGLASKISLSPAEMDREPTTTPGRPSFHRNVFLSAYTEDHGMRAWMIADRIPFDASGAGEHASADSAEEHGNITGSARGAPSKNLNNEVFFSSKR